MVKKFTLVKLIIISIVVPFTVIHAMGDEFMSCDNYSRRESRVLEAIPCDMTTTNYCKIKGPSYPEAAIWRFKEENRALMRRMYGDMESTSVYREMRQMSTNMDDEEQDSSRSSLVYTGSGFMPDLFSGRYNIRMGSGLATVQSAKEPVVESGSVEKIRIKVKKKIKKKIIKDNKNNSAENNNNNNSDSIVKTSTTTSTSSVFATTSESPSPMSTTTPNESTKSPSPTTTFSASTMTTQIPFEEVTSFEDPNDTTTYNVEDQTNAEDEEFIPDPEARIAATTMKYPPIEFEDPVKYEGESQHACPVLNEVFAPYWVNNTRNQVRAILNLHPFEQYIHMEKCLNEGEEMLCRKGCRCEQQYRLHRLLAFDPNNECRGIFSDWFRFPSYCICKCYNFPSDFLSKPAATSENEPSNDEPIIFEDDKIKEPESLPKPSPQLQVLSQKGRSLQNIPVHLPYEAKQALLRELQSRNERNMDQPFFYSAPVMEYNLSNGEQGAVGQTPRK